MADVLILQGLPASGKTTLARRLIQTGEYDLRINRDDLRRMMHDGEWSEANEKLIVQARNSLLTQALGEGKKVIIDDTNFAEGNIRIITNIAKSKRKGQATVIVQTVTAHEDPLENYAICVQRDKDRPHGVGEPVIREMFQRYIISLPTPTQQGYISPVGKPACVMVDIDGTLARRTNRGPYDYDKCGDDALNQYVLDAVNSICILRNAKLFILSGRDSRCRALTETWLVDQHVLREFELAKHFFMRSNGDRRPDDVVKKEIFDHHIRDNYQVVAVFDDRLRVCRLWHSLGLPLFRVGDPDASY